MTAVPKKVSIKWLHILFYLHNKLKCQKARDGEHTCGTGTVVGACVGGVNIKYREFFCGDGTVLNLDCGSDYTNVYSIKTAQRGQGYSSVAQHFPGKGKVPEFKS